MASAKPSKGSLMAVPIPRGEARITNHRGEDRLRDIIDHSFLYFRRRKHAVPVINVSSRGAMIDADVDARIGETVELQFAPGTRTKCTVRWARDGRIGLEFVNETIVWDCFLAEHSGAGDSLPQEADREPSTRAPRHALMRMGSLYWNGLTLPVRLRNISEGGAQLESGHDLAPGAEVELNLGEAGFVYAEVRWSKDGQVGLRFAEEFDMASLAPAATQESPAHDMMKPAYLETEQSADSPWAARFETLSLEELLSRR